MELYSLSGMKLKDLMDGYQESGEHEFRFVNDYAAGVYYLKLRVKSGSGVCKVVVVN